MEKVKITVYTTSEFFGSVNKYEGYLIDYGKMKYAQYDFAPFVSFVPKGKRNGVRIVKGYNPFILILKGWNHPEAQGMYGEARQEGNVIIKESKYQSFDDRYKTDFNGLIDPYILKQGQDVVLADFREAVKIEA